MASFRVLVVLFRHDPLQNRVSKEKMIIILIGIELTFTGMFVITSWIGQDNSASALVMQFCKGHSSEMETTIRKYEGVAQETLDYGAMLTKMTVLGAQATILCEMSCYIYLYCYLFKHDRGMASTVSRTELRRRQIGNAINLSGQAISFAIETLILTLTQILLLMGNSRYMPPASFICMMIVVAAVNNVSLFVSSPELRRTYFN